LKGFLISGISHWLLTNLAAKPVIGRWRLNVAKPVEMRAGT